MIQEYIIRVGLLCNWFSYDSFGLTAMYLHKKMNNETVRYDGLSVKCEVKNLKIENTKIRVLKRGKFIPLNEYSETKQIEILLSLPTNEEYTEDEKKELPDLLGKSVKIETTKLYIKTELILSNLHNSKTHLSSSDLDWLEDYIFDGLQLNFIEFSFEDFPKSIVEQLYRDKSGVTLAEFLFHLFEPCTMLGNVTIEIDDLISPKAIGLLVDFAFEHLGYVHLQKSAGIPLHYNKKSLSRILSGIFQLIANRKSPMEIELFVEHSIHNSDDDIICINPNSLN